MRNLRHYITCVKINKIDHTAINSTLLTSIHEQLSRFRRFGNIAHILRICNIRVGVSNSPINRMSLEQAEFPCVGINTLLLGSSRLYCYGDELFECYQKNAINIRYRLINKLVIQFTQSNFTIEYVFKTYDMPEYLSNVFICNSCKYEIFALDCDKLRDDLTPNYEIAMSFNRPNFDDTTSKNYKNILSSIIFTLCNSRVKRSNGKLTTALNGNSFKRFIRTTPSQTIIGDKLLLSVDLSRVQTTALNIYKDTHVLNDKYLQIKLDMGNV